MIYARVYPEDDPDLSDTGTTEHDIPVSDQPPLDDVTLTWYGDWNVDLVGDYALYTFSPTPKPEPNPRPLSHLRDVEDRLRADTAGAFYQYTPTPDGKAVHTWSFVSEDDAQAIWGGAEGHEQEREYGPAEADNFAPWSAVPTEDEQRQRKPMHE